MPSVPPAPPTFSTRMVWPMARPIDSPIRRATVSVGPPAAAGTMIVIGLAGNAVCAIAGCDAHIEAAAMAPERTVRRLNRIALLPEAFVGRLPSFGQRYGQVSRAFNRHTIIQIFDIISRQGD